MAQSRDVYRRRRLGALGILGILAAAATLAGAAGGAGDDGHDPGAAARPAAKGAAKPKPKPKPKKPPELPLGRRKTLPHYRVVAYYGAPQSHELGALGIGSPDAARRRRRGHAGPAAAKAAPLLLRFRLIR